MAAKRRQRPSQSRSAAALTTDGPFVFNLFFTGYSSKRGCRAKGINSPYWTRPLSLFLFSETTLSAPDPSANPDA
jgi:hypothetical protein